MNTTASMDGPRNIYWPSSYQGEIPLITQNQKEELTALIYQNITNKNERELKLQELEDLTEADACLALFHFSSGIWS